MICFIEASIDNLTLILQEKTTVVVMWGGREGGREGEGERESKWERRKGGVRVREGRREWGRGGGGRG